VRKRVRNHLLSVHHRNLLEDLALIDSLTEIANRRRYDETLESEWRRSSRSNSPLSLAVIDVDYFKAYNDHLGHAEGDLVLRQIGQAVNRLARRPGDLAARYGGEEFVLLLPSTNAHGANQIAEEILEAVIALQLIHPASPVSKWVTVSVGGHTTIPNGAEVNPDFFKTADAALYLAKATGRNRVVWR
jgi:diguanylate cyclase (GGDEF)-like protein